MRATPIKTVTPEKVSIERVMYFRSHRLEQDLELCAGCQICTLACPEEAISVPRPPIVDGHLVKHPTADIDEKKCTFCGVCAQICPWNAIVFSIDNEPCDGVLEDDFPDIVHRVHYLDDACDPECNLCRDSCSQDCIEYEEGGEVTIYQLSIDDTKCDLCGKCTECKNGALTIEDGKLFFDAYLCTGIQDCVKLCPTGAIEFSSETIPGKKVVSDSSKCVACGWCEGVCPNSCLVVEKPFYGSITIDASKCQPDCDACIDACPCAAILPDLTVAQEYCTLCGACENTCPQEGAVTIKRERVHSGPANSGTWYLAHQRLTGSAPAFAKQVHNENLVKAREDVPFPPSEIEQTEGGKSK